ncbi:MAG: hypothetical protein JO260_00540 [Acidobacteria bacterium]|nr:hypothetical protein [Acidobacteriota bacterium]
MYAIELGWPAGGEAVIGSLRTGVSEKVETVSLLGSSEKISFEQLDDGLHLRLPACAGEVHVGISSYLRRREVAGGGCELAASARIIRCGRLLPFVPTIRLRRVSRWAAESAS